MEPVPIETLPPEDLINILHKLDLPNLLSMCSSSKYVLSVCNEKFWREKYRRKFGKPRKRKSESWKVAYIKKVNFNPRKKALSLLSRLTIIDKKYLNMRKIREDIDIILRGVVDPNSINLVIKDLRKGGLFGIQDYLSEPIDSLERILMGRCRHALTREENILSGRIEEILVGFMVVTSLTQREIQRKYQGTRYIHPYKIFL